MTLLSSISKNVDTAWNAITAALASNYLVGCDTSSSSIYSLPTSHAYAVVGTYNLTDASGNLAYRLLHVRNPWGIDHNYWSGPWSDTSSLWTTAFKAQVPYINSNEGEFFIAIGDFVNAFYYYQIAYVHDNWHHSYYSKTSDDGSTGSYTFTNTAT
jgi:calpain-15